MFPMPLMRLMTLDIPPDHCLGSLAWIISGGARKAASKGAEATSGGH